MADVYKPEIKCQFGKTNCLCQWCEAPCNNGMECFTCEMAGEAMHDTYLCTGFKGIYPWSGERKKDAKEDTP